MKYNSRAGIILFVGFLFIFQGRTLGQDTMVKRKTEFLTGQITLNTTFYQAGHIESRRKPFSYFITGSPVLHIKEVSIPFNFTISEQDRLNRQPFNQLGIVPSWRWLKVYVGYSNINWSSYTLAGHNMRGIGIEANPGKFRLGLAAGRYNRAIKEDTNSKLLQTPSFQRNGFAFKVGYGKESFIDLIVLSQKDHPNSIPYVPEKTTVLPSANSVLGLNAHYIFSKSFSFDGEMALSGYTRDLRAVKYQDSNSGTTGLWKPLLEVNTSTQFYKSIQTGFEYKANLYKIKLQYKRVDPDYRSMGAYYFQSDVERITLAPSVHTKKNKLRFDASIGTQHDNLNHRKAATSSRIIGSGNITWNPFSFFGTSFLYSNYSMGQRSGAKNLIDSLKQNINTQTIGFVPHLFLQSKTSSQMLLFNINKIWLTNRNKFSGNGAEYTMQNMNLTYSLNLVKSFTGLTISLNKNRFTNAYDTTRMQGISFGFTKGFKENRMPLGITAGFTNNSGTKYSSKVFNLNANAGYKITEKQSLNAFVNYMLSSSSNTLVQPSYHEIIVNLSYTKTF